MSMSSVHDVLQRRQKNIRFCLKREISGLRVSKGKKFQLKPKLIEQ